MTVTERLFTLQDTKYRDFSARLTPNISKDAVIGVRAPAIRALAKELYGKTRQPGLWRSFPINTSTKTTSTGR